MSDEPENAVSLSRKAVQFDEDGNFPAAIYYYREAAKYIDGQIINNPRAFRDHDELRKAALHYLSRADTLEESLSMDDGSSLGGQQALQRCNFLFSQGLDADERGLKDAAVDLYLKTVEFVLQVKRKYSQEVQFKLTERAQQALNRAEELKGIVQSDDYPNDENLDQKIWTSGELDQRPPLYRRGSSRLIISGGSLAYTYEEKCVLLSTSKINGIDYVPFMRFDMEERYQYSKPFADKTEAVPLSPKQKSDFVKWARPDQLFSQPTLVCPGGADFSSIKQTVISDCSFVASLAVGALYEKKFQKKLVTSIIYPRDKDRVPVYNPFGKYMVKLHLNGIPRKVVVDDALPVGKYGQLLCSYTTNPGEFWVSLLEKAYMKVMGGYDFPGSNSNIDLHVLTGWIPERIAIRPNESDFNAESIFQMLEERIRIGHCIGTVATGEIPDAEAERTGLVPTHAYAILNVVTVSGVKLVQLKNPWSHVRWRGNYSNLDLIHWTPEMRAALDFDPEKASACDNGIFWIDYESILKFFDVFYLNWNPEIFGYTYCLHEMWKSGVGPKRDTYNMGDNPQFRLHVPGSQPGSLWILLTRHITDVNDFKDNREFIAILVYKNNGNTVYYPNDPPPYIDGVRINSPHYLCKVILTEKSSRTYTLVVSQYEKINNLYYTLRVYSTLPFTLSKIEDRCRVRKVMNDEWKGENAGGCSNNRDTYRNNPCYQFVIESKHNSNSMVIILKGPKEYQLGFDMRCVFMSDSSQHFTKRSSGPYRSGFVIMELDSLPPATYSIIPTTYNPGEEGPFILEFRANCAFTVTKVR